MQIEFVVNKTNLIAEYTQYGRYYPQTTWEPAEYPSVDIIRIYPDGGGKLEDFDWLPDYETLCQIAISHIYMRERMK